MSPSPTQRISYQDVESWGNGLKLLLDPTPFTVRGPTTEAIVVALPNYIKSVFGSEPYQPDADSVDFVELLVEDEFSLLGKSGYWNSGDSVGVGVCRTILSGLMALVCSDQAIWKQLGDANTLELAPAGIPPDPNRMKLIKAHGFACRLYVVQVHGIPPQLCPSLAYSLLVGANADEELLHDRPLIHLAPHIKSLLETWPASQADFVTKQNDPVLSSITNDYYAQMLLFGFGAQFATAPEITAFAQGFNGCIPSTSDLKLGQTFGTSLKKLMPALLERRLMSPEEVLSHLVWQPSGVDELEVSEAKYETAFRRYLNGKGVVQHPLLPRDRLQDIEKEVSEDDLLARARMFLICVTGLDILPQNKGKIEMTFMLTLEGKRSAEASDEIDKGDPEKNPDGWMGHVYQKALVQVHSCFDSVDLPLDNVIGLLEQPIPDDDSICTNFDLYQYMMYRLTTRYLEFGGLVRDYPVFVPLRLILR
ncbi:hypothetical protein K438DRAFT_1990477 [Mycena galopus ATCC 62051]|nr:hypothetical protein K438DRAFT_1990477 [Mycena galopus ATCC 62051]